MPGVQSTQRLAVTSHAGVEPEHAVMFVAVHATHAPLAPHAGVAPPHSVSAPQPRHTRVVASHTGAVLVVQSLFARQPRHTFATTSHTGVGVAQSLLARHCTMTNAFGADIAPVVAPTATAAEAVCAPTVTSVEGVNVKFPDASAIVRPTSTPSM